MSPEIFQTYLQKQYQIHLSALQMQQFHDYFEFLVAQNQQVNLTAITDEGEVYLKHFFDSLTPYLYFPQLFSKQDTMTVCDIGAGAGFPSLPLKILCPGMQITIIDSLNKRIKFLEALVAKLQLQDVTLVHGRAEDFARVKQPLREHFDLVLSRAVANLPVLAEFCLPYTKLEGYFLALKGQKGAEELAAGRYAIATLGGKILETQSFTLPDTDEQRDLILVQKKKVTPKTYPRKAGTPVKKPLSK